MMFSVMLFIFFCFFGVLAMLFYMLRQEAAMFQQLREELAQQRILLRALECRIDSSGPDGRRPAPAPHEEAPGDPLLSLSFEVPDGQRQADGLDIHLDPPEGQAASR